MSLYRNILGQALKISWHHKYLWFFGLFAACLGNINEYEILFRGLGGQAVQDLFSGFGRLIETGIFSREALFGIGKIISLNPLVALFLLIISLGILALFIFLVWLVIVSQIALVKLSAKIITSRPRLFKIKEGVISGIKDFWPVLGLNLISKLIIYLTLALLGLLAIAPAGQTFIYLIAFIVFIPISIILSFIIKYAIAYIVIQGSSFAESIKQGWRLFSRNWIISLEIAFILFAITFLAGFISIIIFKSLDTVFVFLTAIFIKLLPAFSFWLFIIIRLVLVSAIIVLMAAILTTWQISVWTGLFIRLIGQGGDSKIARLFGKALK